MGQSKTFSAAFSAPSSQEGIHLAQGIQPHDHLADHDSLLIFPPYHHYLQVK